jgi:hypothetical protein
MAPDTCAGCGEPFTKVTRSREHILPQWLAREVEQPDLSLRHYLHSEDQPENALLRSHDLRSFVIKNVCTACNNGWMSQLEGRAQTTLLGLMHMAGLRRAGLRRHGAGLRRHDTYFPARRSNRFGQATRFCCNRYHVDEFDPNSGSSLAIYRSRRCGFKPASFQTR